jgi:hypothetical protein
MQEEESGDGRTRLKIIGSMSVAEGEEAMRDWRVAMEPSRSFV